MIPVRATTGPCASAFCNFDVFDLGNRNTFSSLAEVAASAERRILADEMIALSLPAKTGTLSLYAGEEELRRRRGCASSRGGKCPEFIFFSPVGRLASGRCSAA